MESETEALKVGNLSGLWGGVVGIKSYIRAYIVADKNGFSPFMKCTIKRISSRYVEII